MSVAWKHRGSGGPDDDLATETLACVERTPERVTMEWRRETRDGRSEVVAARFKPDGTLLGAWRGPPGGVGAPLRIVQSDPEETIREAERHAAPFGLSPADVESDSSVSHETIETPAGRFRCTVRRIEASYLFFKLTITCAYPDDPLPLSPIVRMEWKDTGMDLVQELVSVQAAGAIPSLRIPE